MSELFWKSIDPGWRPVAFVLRRVWPDFLSRDLRHLERLGEATSWHEVPHLANDIRSDEALNRGLLRKTLRLRISGARVLRVR